ncbi:helix-turn-helix domain-containing protein, partial [Pelomicrobium sp. G1]|uniref:helix-turn-helix domain-containing protein n=1 Tax=Pelomicrobium sp. G1 TaxID=3452920 RepID=UPI003F7691B1
MAHERKDVKGRKDAFARELGARLREAREKAGLNQAQMAALAGVSETALGNYERGKRLAPIDVV